MRKTALDHLAKQVPDEALRRTLTPHYEPGCKRLLLSDDYYPSLTRSNVEVVDSPVASFTAHEVVGQDGIARPVDVVIMGTGFDAAEPPYAEHIVGRDGVRLSEVWKANGVEAYAGSTVAGFPNLFLMIGPNSTLAHNSMIFMIESHINYIAGALAFLRRPGRERRGGEAFGAAALQRVAAVPARALGLGRGRLRQLVPGPSRPQHDAVAGPHLEVPPAHPALSPWRVHRPRIGP